MSRKDGSDKASQRCAEFPSSPVVRCRLVRDVISSSLSDERRFRELGDETSSDSVPEGKAAIASEESSSGRVSTAFTGLPRHGVEVPDKED